MTAIPNRNMLWASVIVDELARSGLDAVVIAPGSRSTPLVMAFAQHESIKTYSLIDERSAAFFALGMALETGKPVAVLCSSGTATANFYPAIIEAHYSNVPLIVLTADRPHELRDSGANQTVDQVRMFGSHVLWSVDVAPPESQPSDVMVRSLRTLANRAYATALGPVGGPVHLNLPLRKPLEPLPVAGDDTSVIGSPREDGQPYTHISRGVLMPSEEQLDALERLITQSPRGLVICGPRTPGGDFAGAVTAFSDATGYPVLADPLSSLRWTRGANVIGGYDTFLPGSRLTAGIDLIIHVGALPASKALEDFFVKNRVPNVVLLTENGVWTDPYHRLSHLVHADAALTLRMLARRFGSPVVDAMWAEQWRSVEAAAWEALEPLTDEAFFDGGVVGKVIAALPDECRVFVASSLPVRHLEQFGRPSSSKLRVLSNRGASGIDGTISSAFGVAAGSPAPTVLITGDLAFYHDMNGLLAAKRTGTKLVVVLLNNDGGGIFRRLPVVEFEPAFTDLFLTPHGLDFEPAARMYGFEYARVENYGDLAGALDMAVKSPSSVLIEARTDSAEDLRIRQSIMAKAAERLRIQTDAQARVPTA